MLIANKKIFTASVGDSRAILASLECLNEFEGFLPLEDKVKMLEMKARRPSIIHNICSVQLTKDHKPDEAKEFERIVAAGGRVKKLIDDQGNRIGPYRVWEATSHSPGLSMSRSLGDSVAKKIGVVAEPTICVHDLSLANDLFLVIGSDGIWDVIDNDDVSNFVEFYRGKCSRHVSKKRLKEVCALNACVAQILCEEARVRWFHFVQEENVVIDDISCIVIEFSESKGRIPLNPKKNKNVQWADLSPINNQHLLKAPTIKDTQIRDPKRGSFSGMLK